VIEIPDLPSLGMAALYAVTFLLALASGLVPFVINTELYLLGVATLTSASPVLMVALATTGQMLGKWVVYGVGRGSLNIEWVRRVGASKAVRTFAGRPATTTSILAFSAVTGIPPFYGVSFLAGVVRMPAPLFLMIGTVGRVVRFSAVFMTPELFR